MIYHPSIALVTSSAPAVSCEAPRLGANIEDINELVELVSCSPFHVVHESLIDITRLATHYIMLTPSNQAV